MTDAQEKSFSVELTPSLLKRFVNGASFADNTKPINSIDFHRSGELLVTAADDQTVNLYNMRTGKNFRQLQSRKYGVDLIRFTRDPHIVICATTIRAWSVSQNQYVRYFKGHRSAVVSLGLSMDEPPFFLSGSLDGTVRLWDERTNACQGLIRLVGHPVVAFDPLGLIFVVAAANALRLYDSRSFHHGPFALFEVPTATTIHHLLFSPDGKVLAVVALDAIYLLDSFTGVVLKAIKECSCTSDCVSDASFSPDGKFLVAGGAGGSVLVFDCAREGDTIIGNIVTEFRGTGSRTRCVAFNPRMCLVASSAEHLVLWTPSGENNSV